MSDRASAPSNLPSGANSTASSVSDAEQPVFVIEGPRPVRDSVLWKFQETFYDKFSIQCWADAMVPNFVTSNAFIARHYARMILGYARDWFLK